MTEAKFAGGTGNTPATQRAVTRHNIGLLNEEDLSNALGLTTNTLRIWRHTGKGPDFVKVGKSIFYRFVDITEWLANSVRKPRDEAALVCPLKSGPP